MAAAAPGRPLRIAIINDYEIVVNGIAKMLAEHPDRATVVEIDNRLPVLCDVDVVLFDVFAFVLGDGMDLADLVRRGCPKVVVYTWTTHPEAVTRALAAGASGYLSKALSTTELIEALEAIHRGEPVLSPHVEMPAAQHDGAWPGRDQGLSQREAEVLALITKGRTNLQIAETMYLSINSVKTYIRSAYAKIDVERRSQAVAWAMRHGFAPDAHREVADHDGPLGESGTGEAHNGYPH